MSLKLLQRHDSERIPQKLKDREKLLDGPTSKGGIPIAIKIVWHINFG